MKKIFLALIAAVLSCSSAFADGNVIFYRSYNKWSTCYGHLNYASDGTAATNIGSDSESTYFVMASSSSFSKIIFSPGSGWTGQGSDITDIVDGAVYYGYGSTDSGSRSGAKYGTSFSGFYGTFNGSEADLAITKKSGTTFQTATLTYTSSVSFGFRLTVSGSQVLCLKPSANLTASNLTTTLASGSGSATISGLESGTTYHLEVDFSTLALTLVIDSVPTVEAPETLYFYGNIYSGNWGDSNTIDGKEMTKSGNVYTLSNVSLTGSCCFFMSEAKGTAWSAFTASDAINYTAAVSQTSVPEGEAVAVSRLKGSYNVFKAANSGLYDVSFDWDNLTVTLTEVAKEADITIYYKNSSTGWDNVAIHFWDSNKNGFTTWPGDAMTYDSDTDLWSYTFTNTSTYRPSWVNGFIFGDGMKSSGNKTSDYEAAPVNGTIYTCTANGADVTVYVASDDAIVLYTNSQLDGELQALSYDIDEIEAKAFNLGGGFSTQSKNGVVKCLTPNVTGSSSAYTYAWVKYEDTDAVVYKDENERLTKLYASDCSYDAFPSDAVWTDKYGKQHTFEERTWAVDYYAATGLGSAPSAGKYECRNFTDAYYRFYVILDKTSAKSATRRPKTAVNYEVKDVDRIALSIAVGDNTTGVDEIVVDGNQSIEDADVPVEYYNLQGIRIANPSSGIYIRRQGNKVSKEFIR